MTPVASTGPALRVPSVLVCGFMIFVVKMSLHMSGFGQTMRWIRKRVEAIPEVASGDLEAIKATEYAVAMAAALYPGRALCLERSLVLYHYLRRVGQPVTFCLGVQPFPFAAHAWVEYRNEPVNDVPEHVKWFTRLPSHVR